LDRPLFISKGLESICSDFSIIDSGANLSDHNPITLSLTITNNSFPINTYIKRTSNKVPPMIRWDKADLLKYYLNSSYTLQNISIPHQLHNCLNCSQPDHNLIINNCCNQIIEALKLADSSPVRRTALRLSKISVILI